MEYHGCVLSDIPGFGRIYDCCNCGNVHITFGPVILMLTPDEFMHMVAMIHAGAANFELWREQRERGGCNQQTSEEYHADNHIDDDII